MKNSNMANNPYCNNYESERVERENEKYGARLPIPQMAAHPHVYKKHSIEPVYGQYDRPINEIV